MKTRSTEHQLRKGNTGKSSTIVTDPGSGSARKILTLASMRRYLQTIRRAGLANVPLGRVGHQISPSAPILGAAI